MTQYNVAGPDGVVYAVQNGDQYVYIYQDRPPYRIEPFPLERPPAPDRQADRAPSWLLDARRRITPFHGRDVELAQLQNWRDRPDPDVSVRLVHAPGGQGKSRLAAEFVELSVPLGWSAATVRHRSEAAAAGGGDQQLAVYATGLLLVVDYAERWPVADMCALLRQHQGAARTPVRVLLLARPTYGWWQSLTHQLGKLDIHDVADIKLGELAPDLADRQAVYRAARLRFAEWLGVADTDLEVPDLAGSEYGLALAVQMKALVDVDALARGVPSPGHDLSLPSP